MIRKKNCDLHKTTACAGVAAFTLNVTRKIDVNTRDGVGNTPIVYAILGGNMEAARELRLLGAKLDGICRNGGSALHLAATKTDTAWLQWAISEGGNLEAKTTVGRTPFHVACQFGNLEGAKYLMGLGVDISAVCMNGDTATHLCASSGNTELLSMLMKSLDVERIDHPNKIGWSPLHVAANYGHVELTRALISAEVDVHRKGMDGRNALDVASSGGWDDVVEVLVAAMAARPFDGHIRLDEIRSSKRICGRRSLGEKCPTTANLKSSEPQGLLKDLLERQRSRLEELEMKSSGGKLPKYDSKTNVQQTCVRLPAPTAVVPINNKSTRPSSRNGTISGPSPGVDIVTISGERLTSSSLAIDTCPSSNISEGQLKSSVLTFQLSACPLTAAGESSTSSSTPTHFDISSNDRADNASPIPQLPHSPLRAVTTVGKGLTSSAPSDDSHHVSPINCHSADDETPVVSLPLSPLNAVTTSSTPSIENSISSINDHRADDELPDHMLPSPLNAITSLSPSIDSQSISPVSHFKADKETPIPSSPPPLNTSAATGVISSPRPSLIPIPVGSSIKSASGERKRNIPTDIVSVGRDHGGVGLLKGGKSTIVQQPMTERRVRRKSLDAKIVGSKQQMSFREVIGSTGIDDEHTDQSGPSREAIERGLDGMAYVIIKGICAAAAAVVASSENSSYLTQRRNNSAGSLRSSADVAAAICHDYSIESNQATNMPAATFTPVSSCSESPVQLRHDDLPSPSIGCIISDTVEIRSTDIASTGADPLGLQCFSPIVQNIKYSPSLSSSVVLEDGAETQIDSPADGSDSASEIFYSSADNTLPAPPREAIERGLDGMGYVIIKGICAAAAAVVASSENSSYLSQHHNSSAGSLRSSADVAAAICHDYSIERNKKTAIPLHTIENETSSTTSALQLKRDSSPTVSNPVSARSVSPVKKASTLGRSSSTPTSGVKETVADKVKRDSSPTVSKNPVSARSVSPVKKASTLGRSSSTPTSGVKETVADKVKRDSSPSVVEEIVFPHVGSTHDDCCETGVTESKAISESPVYEPVSLSEIVAEESSIGIGSVTDGINEKSCSPQTELEFDSSNTSIYRGKKPVGFSRDRYLSKVPSRPVESDDESSDDVHSVSNTDSTVASVVEAKIEGHEPLESYDSTCDLQEVSSKGSPSRCPDSDITDENVIQDSPEEYSIEATSRKVRLAKIKDKKARLEAARNIDSGLESTTTLQGDELEPQIDSSVDVSAHDISGNFVDTFRNVSDVIDPVGKESRPDSVNCNEDLKDTIFVDKGDNTYFTNEQELKNDRAGRGKKPVGSYRDRYLSQLSSRPVESDDESSDDVHSVSDTDSIVASVVEAKIEDHTASCTPHKGSQERCTDFDITEVVVVLDTPEENISSAISQSSDDNGSESDRIKRNVADPCLLSVAEKAALFSGGSNLSKRMVPSGNDKLVDKDTASCGDDMSLNEMNSSVHDTALPFGEQINSDGTVNDLDDALNLPQAQEESESCITVAGRIALFDRQRLKAEEVSSEDSDDDIQKQMERAERAMKAHISENLSRTTNADKSIHNKSEEFPLGISSASECNSGNDISASPCEVDSAAHENSYHREEDETTGASSAIRSPDIDSDGGNDSLGEILMKHETTPEINEDEYVTPAMPDEISGNNSTALSHNSNEKVTPDFDSEASNHIPKEPSLARRRFSRAITAVRAANRLSGGMLSRHNKPINERVKESGDGTKHIASRVSVFGGKKKGKLAEQSPDPDTSNVAISSNENILAPSPRLAAYLNSGNSKQDDRALKSDTEFQRGVASFRRQLSRSSSKPFVSEIEGVTVDYAELNGSTVLEDVGASQRKHEYDDPVLGRPPRHENTDTAGVSFDESVLQSTVSEVIDPEGERTKHPTVGKSTLKSVAIGDEGHGRLRDSVHRGKSEQDVGGIGERESIGEGAVRSGHDHEIVDNERLRERGHRNRSSRELVDNERHRERVHRSRSSRDVGGTGERESIGEGAVRGGGDRHREGVRRSRSSRDVGGTGERESIGEGDRHREGVHRSRSSRELDDNERHRERVHRSRSSRNVGGTGERESIGEGALRGGGDRHRDGVHRSRSSRELDDNGRHRERVHRSRSSRDVGGIGERESIGEGAVRGGGDRHREGVHRSRSSRDVGGTGERESIGEGAVRGGSGRHREGVHRSRSSRELDDNGRHRDRVHRSRSSRDVGGTGERESIGEGAVRSRHDHDIADNERLRERSHRNRSSRELDDNGRHRKRVHRSRSSRDVGGTGERESIGEGAVRSGHDHEIADNERLRERGHRNRSSRELDDNERHRERVHRSRSSRDVGGTSERESIGEGAVRGGGDRHREGVHRSRSSRDAGGIGERESIGGVDRHREGVHRSRSSRDITSSDPAGLDETVAGNSRSRRNSSLTSLTERRVRRKSTDSKPIGHSNGLSQIGGSERGDSLPSKDSRSIQESASVANDNDSNAQSGSLTVVSSRRAYDRARRRAARSGRSPREHVDGDWLSHSVMELSASSEEDGVLTPVARDRKGRPTISRANSATHRGVQDKIDAWAKDYDSIAQEEVQGENELASELHAWLKMSHDHSDVEKAATPPVSVQDPLDKVDSFDSYVSYSVQRSLEIEWRLSQLESKMPDPDVIHTIRTLLHGKTQVIKKLKNRHNLSPDEISSLRSDLRRMRIEMLDLVKHETSSLRDPENVIKEELESISAL